MPYQTAESNKIDCNAILEKMRLLGYRITPQRKIILSAIIENPNFTCKELIFLLKSQCSRVSQASVYRTMKEFKDLGFVRQRGFIQTNFWENI